MYFLKKRKPKPTRDAFEWFVLNDSGGLLESDNWPAWNEWRHMAGNKAKYVEVLDLIHQLRKLAPPEAVSREELVEDAAKDPPVLEPVVDGAGGPRTH